MPRVGAGWVLPGPGVPGEVWGVPGDGAGHSPWALIGLEVAEVSAGTAWSWGDSGVRCDAGGVQ